MTRYLPTYGHINFDSILDSWKWLVLNISQYFFLLLLFFLWFQFVYCEKWLFSIDVALLKRLPFKMQKKLQSKVSDILEIYAIEKKKQFIEYFRLNFKRSIQWCFPHIFKQLFIFLFLTQNNKNHKNGMKQIFSNRSKCLNFQSFCLENSVGWTIIMFCIQKRQENKAHKPMILLHS